MFDEVAEIHSDHVLRTYLELMLEMEELDEAEYARVIDFAAEIDSDHSSGELLLAVVEVAGLQPAFQGPMLRAAEAVPPVPLVGVPNVDLNFASMNTVLETGADGLVLQDNTGRDIDGVTWEQGRWSNALPTWLEGDGLYGDILNSDSNPQMSPVMRSILGW